MRAAISINHAAHQREHGQAMAMGLARHGIVTCFTQADRPVESVDFHVVWSIKRPQIMAWAKRTGRHVLVQERGYLPNRMIYSSLGWDGLNGRARFPAPLDGSRWGRLFARHLRPWRVSETGAALLCGQVAGDASIYGLDLDRWAQQCTSALRAAGYRVLYRPHPLSVRQKGVVVPKGAMPSPAGSLREALEHADVCVTYNSNSGVEAALYGTPVIALDEGSMAWPVAAHAIGDPLVRPDRTGWGHRLSWCQFDLEEIRSGFAWEALRTCL